MFKKIGFCCFLLVVFLFNGITQQAGPSIQPQIGAGIQSAEHLQLAVSSRDYPVTLGDVYQLTYRQTAGTMLSLAVQIDGAGFVSLGVFGKIDANGLTFVQLKQKVEELIAKNYAYSLPELSITAPAVFRVTVRDGSSGIQYATAWGLSRLSEVVAEFYTSTTSLRNVELISLAGVTKRYDLLRAALSNESGFDPLVKPGDTIILHSPGKVIQLSGEIRRPGFYELMGEEGLKDLIETFGGGLSSKADGNRVRINRTTELSERTDYISLPAAYSARIPLNDGDTVLIRAKGEQLSLIWFEGAVSSGPVTSSLSSTAALPGSTSAITGAIPALSGVTGANPIGSDGSNGRFSYQIREGQMLSDILQDIRTNFSPQADLGGATLFFKADSLDTGVPINIPALLSGSDMSTNVPLFAGYRIVIPVIGTTVMVSGAVYSPGKIQFKPNAPASYYMILAGGVDSWRNSFRACDIYDKNGDKRKPTDKIQPGDQIHVLENNINYQIERRVPVIASVLGLITSIITFSVIIAP